jgi:hypothetical protein
MHWAAMEENRRRDQAGEDVDPIPAVRLLTCHAEGDSPIVA